MARKPLVLGGTDTFTGDVTTLKWIGARPPNVIEASLGYHSGRLADGYWILLLTEKLQPADFEFGGTTLRSGGREGLPDADATREANRPRIHDRLQTERGAGGYEALQTLVLKNTQYKGPDRIAKVLPLRPHDATLTQDVQYPPGGGGLQWKLVKPKSFLVALKVGPSCIAEAPGFTASVADGAPYEGRAKVARYLEQA